jgi:endonuclease/exonuclease/phosphatase family metal-dependent hydrolase
VEELGAWVQGLDGRPQHLVVAGDLNVDGPDYSHLLQHLPLADAYREHDPSGAGLTFDPATNAHAARGRLRGAPGQRIDYVLYRAGGGLRVRRAAIAFRDPPLLSDHYGLVVDFAL